MGTVSVWGLSRQRAILWNAQAVEHKEANAARRI